MNRTRLAGFLVLLGGSVAGGLASLSTLLPNNSSIVAMCGPDGGSCVLSADPDTDQCAVLLEGGGDRPGELSGLDGENADAARALNAMVSSGVISGFRTVQKPDGGCTTFMLLTRQQAEEWKVAFSEADAGIKNPFDGASSSLTPTSSANAPVQWGGGPGPEERTEAYSLFSADGGNP